MVLQRNRLLRNSSESNPVIVNLDSGIRAMRENILTTIHSVQKGLLITKPTSTVRPTSSTAASAMRPRRNASSSASPGSRRSKPDST